jgi:hypothetical protein
LTTFSYIQKYNEKYGKEPLAHLSQVGTAFSAHCMGKVKVLSPDPAWGAEMLNIAMLLRMFW